MPTTTIYGQDHGDFNAYNQNTAIQLRNHIALQPAKYLVFQTNNTGNVLGAGKCPALTANPNYASVVIPANIAFTVQAAENDVDVTY